MFSTTTSAVLTRSRNIARPRSDFRLRVTPFLHELSSRKNHASSPRLSDSAVRPGSPVGGSILMTSAPSHASIWVQLGPASYWVRSRTRIPSRALAMVEGLRYVVYAENRTVVARALESVMTLTTAGLPEANARSSAGRMSCGFSTNSPCAPSSMATRS